MPIFDRGDIADRGFVGFLPLHTLDRGTLPLGAAVYAVLLPNRCAPLFLNRSPAGWWKGKDPTVSAARMQKEWLSGVDVVYLGKADSLRSRVGLLLDFAAGQPVRHWGGRLLWQTDVAYEIAWMETPRQDPELVEKAMLREFSGHYRALPFANLRH
jgi:hypothetical protein